MPPSSRIPPLLQPYVGLPKDKSILLLTSTLGASANWLVIRFLCDALNTTHNGGEGGGEGANVVLVSCMREHEFWKQEARKGGGLDLEKCRREGTFAFVDALSALFLDAPPQGVGVGMGTQAARAPQTLPLRGAPPGRTVLVREPPAAAARQGAQTDPAGNKTASASSSTPAGLYTLQSADVAHLKATVLTALSHVCTNGRKTLLVLDNPDVLIATSATPTRTLTSLMSLLLTLHTQIPHILVHTQSDDPLLTLSSPQQPIEHAQHNFLVKLAHMSRRILSVRVLDTGVARDVSGVLRITENTSSVGGTGLIPKDEEERETDKGGTEVLYRIGGDGGVKVFERGAGES
ncbi:hypothetical protein K458DRAFT_437973 [Lentithecium fluviatile CBS 122367]|uniref:Elongator complex protein 5 n=1 Tax=Lentithecium fluviatile CBS 122367 TaxID=1168545 RepID=A0A6G1JN02_9PLEO|nr:hypothetical protein K458DRAFT_437973 [Lentithecium fluviatile CBS 122367]